MIQSHKTSTIRTAFYKETEAQRCKVIIPKSHSKNKLEPDLNSVVCDSRAQAPNDMAGCCSETNVRNDNCEERSLRERTLLKTYRSERLTHRIWSRSGRQEEKGITSKDTGLAMSGKGAPS